MASRSTDDPQRIRLELTEPVDLDFLVAEDAGDLDHGCGGGFWCAVCRSEIRAEALQWLHELAEGYRSTQLVY